MKKTIALGMLLCVLLCGCENKSKDPSQPNDTDTGTRQEESVTDSGGAESDDSATRIAYYEQLVTELQQELLQMKTELYTSRVEYESRIAELEAQKSPENNSGTGGSEISESFTYTLENGVAVITAYSGSEREVTVPATIDGYTVWAIGDRAFMDNASLTSVTLPKTVTKIGWFAFSGCISLENVAIPETVEAIAYGAFQNCPSTLTITCASGSYAEQYARSYGLRVK